MEGGDYDEDEKDRSCDQFIKVVEYAATQPNIPFISIKVTGIARFALLEKMDELMQKAEGTLVKRYEQTLEKKSARSGSASATVWKESVRLLLQKK